MDNVINNIAEAIVTEAKFRVAKGQKYANLSSAIYEVKLEVVNVLMDAMAKANEEDAITYAL